METGENNFLKFNFVSDKFKVESCSNYHLSIELSNYFLRYAVLDIDSLNYLMLREYSIKSENLHNLSKKIVPLIDTDDFIKRKFFSYTLSISSIKCIINELYKTTEKEKRKMLEIETDVYENIKHDLISYNEKNLEIIYSIPNNLNNLFSNYFNSSSIFCSDSVLINSYLKETDKSPFFAIYICVNNIYISYFNNKQIIFHNKFIFNSEEDILYLTLYTIRQLKINLDKCLIKIGGRINESLKSLFSDYLKKFKTEKSKLENTDTSNFKIVLNQIV